MFKVGDRVRVLPNYLGSPDLIDRIGTVTSIIEGEELPYPVLVDFGGGPRHLSFAELELLAVERPPILSVERMFDIGGCSFNEEDAYRLFRELEAVFS